MYLYFDRKGTLLEMVNDEALRRYNKNINYVYVYMENEEDQNEFVAGLKCLAYRFKKPDGRFTIEYLTDQQEHDEALHDVMIPVDVKRDLKHFRYGVKYAMHKIRIPSGDEIVEDKNGNGIIDGEEQGIVFEDNVFELAGPVEMGIQAVFDTSRYTLGKVVFAIENAVIKTTQGITLSQFDYLLKRVNEVEKMEGPEGPQGEAAGFGEPTANVTMLEPTEQATVSITTEGPNTQKVFNFDFSIPRGNKGDTGEQGPEGPEGPQGEVGKGFSIEKVYISVEEMEADFDNEDVPFNSFVLIDTGDVEDEENSRLYVKLESGFSYLTDLSGSQGIQGPQGPIGPQGQRGKEGLSVYIYDGILTETTTTITDKTQILLPSGRTLHEGDILLSSLEGYVGAMAKIESVTENEIVVDYIGALEVQTEGGGSFVARTQEELVSLLTAENEGKLITYIGEAGDAIGTEFAVGNEIDRIYFNTDIEPNLSSIPYGENGIVQPILTSDTAVTIVDNLIAHQGENVHYIACGGLIVYCDADFEAQSLTKGWQLDRLNEQKAYMLSSTETVMGLNLQEYWHDYISKTPFVEYEKNIIYIVTKNGDEIVAEPYGGEIANGITDVQVAGTSVVADGVANIPAADINTAGVVTNGDQYFQGHKYLYGTLVFMNGNSAGESIRESGRKYDGKISFVRYGYACNVRGSEGYSSLKFNLKADAGANYATTTITAHKGAPCDFEYYYEEKLGAKATTTLPSYTGTLMSAPSAWSEGTSGSATLPEAGLYEVYFVKDTVTYSTIVRWNNDWVQTICGAKDVMQGTEVYILDIGQTGLIDLFEKNMADGGSGGAPATVIYFRKIGIA